MTKIERFDHFVAARFEFKDWSNFLSADRSRLSRTKILEACMFARSTLYQNEVIKKRLFELEAELGSLGVLKISHAAPSTSLDEAYLLTAVAKLEERLKSLGERMTALSSSVQSVRKQIQNFGLE